MKNIDMRDLIAIETVIELRNGDRFFITCDSENICNIIQNTNICLGIIKELYNERLYSKHNRKLDIMKIKRFKSQSIAIIMYDNFIEEWDWERLVFFFK